MTLRLAVITDIHHGPPTQTKRGDAALALTADFVRFANEQGVDAVLELGDRISDVDPATDHASMAEVARLLDGLAMPRHHLDGNHDLIHLDRADNARILGREAGHRIVPLGAWDLVLWQADPATRNDGMRSLALKDDDFTWLADVAKQATRPLLIASHTPVSPHPMTGNFYFENIPQCGAFPQAAAMRRALGEARAPVAAISGHVHWNTLAADNGITYLTQQSLTESFTTSGEPAGAWGVITLGDDIRWQVFGRDPFEARFAPAATRWKPVMQWPRETHAAASERVAS